jgi:hypothetical protein
VALQRESVKTNRFARPIEIELQMAEIAKELLFKGAPGVQALYMYKRSI